MRVLLFYGALAVGLHLPGVAVAGSEEASDAFENVLRQPILDSGVPLSQVRAYVTARIPQLITPKSVEDWEKHARAIRTDMLDKIIFRGEAARWRNAETRVKWFDAIQGGSDYAIRKFRYEAVPGMWIPGLLYEPKRLEGKVPVFINVNGHDPLGKATPETQRRCINLAKRGALTYLLEFIYFGQLHDPGNRHNTLVQLDLCGTSGVAPFVLALTRGLDVALAHPHADKTRVGVAGLSGGGWQTITLASLDTRITLANPVAGYASMFTRAQYSRDVGDAEQIPSDMCTVADYTHLTGTMAPRPLLLTYNSKDECCFLPEGSLPPLEAAARPIYAMYNAADRFRTHVNHNPGTHNFERENREALYRLVGDFFYPGDAKFIRTDISIPKSELKAGEELAVPLPPENATLHSLAVQLSNSLPDGAEWGDKVRLDPERTAARQRLRDVVRLEHYDTRAQSKNRGEVSGVQVTGWEIEMDDHWTVPAVEFVPPGAKNTTVVIGDGGRGATHATVRRLVESGERVLAVDLLGLGEAGKDVASTELQMIATVGRRPLGVQAGQLIALTHWLHDDDGPSPVNLVAVGPRSSAIALVAAAVEPDAITAIELHDSWPSLKEFINKNLELKDAPELGCFGLLQEFDIPQLEALITPRTVSHVEAQ